MTKITRRNAILGLLGLALAPGCTLPKRSELHNYKPLTNPSFQPTPEQISKFHQAIARGRKFKKDKGLESHYYDLQTGERSELFKTPQETEKNNSGDCDDRAIWLADQADKLQIPNYVVIGRLSPDYKAYHAWNELLLPDIYVADISIDDIVGKKGYIKKSDLPSTHYQGLFSFTGPYTEERLEKLQKEWSEKVKELKA